MLCHHHTACASIVYSDNVESNRASDQPAEMASQASGGISGVHQFCVVRGHRVYKLWTPVVGEKLLIDVEEDNDNDPRAVAMLRSGVVVGHLPRKTARTIVQTELYIM